MSALDFLVLLAGTALRWTPLLIAAGMLTASARWLSARGRHLVWLGALAALPLLPVLHLALPSWSFGAEVVTVPSSDTAPASSAPIATAPSTRFEGTVGAAAAVPASIAQPSRTRDFSAPLALAALWALIATGLLARLGLGRRALHRLLHDSEPARDPRLLGAARDAAVAMGVRRPFRLLLKPEDLVPMTWGWRRPVVLLPSACLEWPAERLRCVLLHELAHLRRADGLAQLLARFVCALFWFHPGAFWAARQLRREAEQACDDLVVTAGASPRVYAGELLTLARGLRRADALPALALAVARGSGLETRLRALLDERRRRAEPALARALVIAALAGLGLALAGLGSASARPAAAGWLEHVTVDASHTAWQLTCGEGTREPCRDAERKALRLLTKSGKTGVIVVQEVASGEILAYVSVAPAGADDARAIPLVPSASVAKLALAALWWEEGLSDRQLPCPPRLKMRNGLEISSVSGREGTIEVPHQMIVLSCNTAGATMAEELLDRGDAAALRQRFESFGFSAPTELSPLAAWEAKWPALAVGAGDLTTTPIEVSGLLQAIGNEGRRLEPKPAGAAGEPGRGEQLFSSETAQKLRRSMDSVVAEGTAQRVLPQLEWSDWRLGGKTGSLMRNGSAGDGWFAGLAYAPDGKPTYTVVVFLEGGGGGGGPAAGMAAEMTRFLARRVGGEL